MPHSPKLGRLGVIAVAVAIALMVLGTSCTTETTMPATPTHEEGNGTTGDVIKIVDAYGRTVSWEAPPQRVVIAGRSNFFLNDVVYAFPEAKERVVALTSARQSASPFVALLDPDYEEKMVLTPESTAEEIAATQPDVVLLKAFMRESLGSSLETLGIPVVYLNLESVEEYKNELEMLGTIFDAPERAQEVWNYYEAQLAQIDAGLADLDHADRPTLLLFQYNTRGAEVALEVPAAGYLQTEMVRMVKADTLWLNATRPGGWSVVNLEQITAWDPETMVVISYFAPVDEVVDRLTGDATWQNLTAVQNGQLYGFPVDYYSWDQPDTRWILGLTWLAHTVHPNQFPDLDMGAEIIEFYNELYALSPETVEAVIFPLLQGDVTP